MFCQHCATQLQCDAVLCYNCGKGLVESQEFTRSPATPTPRQATAYKKHKWPFVLAGLFIFVLIWAFGDEEPAPENITPAFEETMPVQTPANTPGLPEGRAGDNGTWAVYWYLCGSDLETGGGFASGDLEEMMQVRLPDNISVIIEIGGAKQWHNGVDANSNSRYLYDSGGLTFLEQSPSANMGSANTLESFLRFCNTNYPADRQVVIFWNHGGGSVGGVAYDERYDFDALTLLEIREAFEATCTPLKDNPPYELIGFDACLMATIDTADMLNGFSRYMVASQDLEPALGWEYTGVFQALTDDPGMTGAQLGKVICDTYYAACEAEDLADDLTLSVVDLFRVEALMNAYYDIGVESLIYACTRPSYFSEYGRVARKAINFGGNNFWDGYTNMVDLGDLVRQSGENLLPEYGQALLDALDDCVAYQVTGPLRGRASGLSSYYNYDGDYDNFRKFASLRSDDPFHWFYDFLITGNRSADGERYVLDLAERYSQPQEVEVESVPSSDSDGLEDFPLQYTDDGFAMIELGQEIADKLIGVYCYVAYYDEENDIIILLGRDNDLNMDWENGVFMDNFRGVWGSIDGRLVYMELIDEADDYQIYTIPIMLNSEEYSLSVSYSYDTEEYKILGARRGIDENGMGDKNLRQLVSGDIIEPLHHVMFDMEDEDEEFTAMAVGSLTVTENTGFEEMDLGDGLFLFMFEMVDARGNSYLSEAAAFSVEDGEIYLMNE